MKYDFRKIEKKWQKRWLDEKIFKARDDSKKPKYYQLETFPYPSAEGLHVGHPKGYIAEDIHARYMRMRGREVLYTMGWDAFGLPTENFAIKVGKSPREVAEANIKNFKRQVQMFGLSYDWDREISTSSPEYYKWTQWLFLQLFKRGLAYRAKARVNWCPKDQTVLANEQVVNGCCERCGAQIEEREMEQWFLRITDYAERLLKDLKGLDWPAATIKRQEDWIGRSEGAELEFLLSTEYNYVLLHGFTGGAKNNFFPWLKRELEKQGAKVWCEDLPHSDNPQEKEQVEFVLKNANIDEHTVVVGHSLGAVVALKVIEKLDKKIAGLITAGGFLEPEFVDHPRPFEKSFNWEFNYKKIKQNIGWIKILSAINDYAVPMTQGKKLQEVFGGELIETRAREGHFCAAEEAIILENALSKIKVFTTRPDTLFGATYMVLAPEHQLVSSIKHQVSNWREVEKYVEQAKYKTELMRKEEAREKTGVELKGVKAINPATKEEIPIWVADYVLASYGTGAIMAVPAHDERDYKFAKKFNLPIKVVIEPETGKPLPNEEFRRSIVAIVEDKKNGKFLTLNWGPKFGGTLFIGGGHENDEDEIKAAVREIQEETGYINLEFVDKTEKMHHHYFAFSKNIGRNSEVVGLHFILTGDGGQDQKLDDHEKGKFRVEWLTRDEVLGRMEDENHILCFRRLILGEIYAGAGRLVDSGSFDGMDSEKAKWEITKFVGGRRKIQYKLRDWSVSRQRYWGCPIPMIHCDKCGIVPVPEKDLPVLLPELRNYRPKGVPPLAASEEFMKVKCPQCGGEAKRDPETLDTFVDSSWYYLRYADPQNDKQFAAKSKLNFWLPVDLYVIGAEHTVLHLLYSRFVTKFLYDEGYLKFPEPFLKLRHQGLILGEGGQKMSKSKGNVVNPDELIGEFGADTARVYEMFMGPFEAGAPWDAKGILGIERFLRRFWQFLSDTQRWASDKEENSKIKALLHKTIKKVGEDIENFKFNTAISALMILLNELEKPENRLPAADYQLPIKLLHPFAPHMAQELWSGLGRETILDFEPWPGYDPDIIREETITLVVQINGRVRDSFEAPADIGENEALKLALGREKIRNSLGAGAKNHKKIVYVPQKLINIVT